MKISTALTILVASGVGMSVARAQTVAAPSASQPTKAITPEARSAAALAVSAEPTFDEGSARRLREAILKYREIASRGGWPAIPADAKFSVGVAGAHDALLRQRLIIGGDLAASEAAGPFDEQVVAGIKRFQTRHGIPLTGTVGARTLAALNVPVGARVQQLEASLQRIASIGFSFGSRYVVVNIPGAFTEAVEDDKVVRRYRVIVGKTDKPTPTVTSEISNVNLNPTWTLPQSVIKKEIAAHMLSDPGYLDRMHMQVFDSRESLIDPNTVDWASEKALNVTVRQESGEWNALGRVRIDMPNSYAVYMHDTNQKSLFSNDYRFDSHGCVRVDNVRDLAAWLLQDAPEWDRAAIDAVIASGERKDIRMPKKIPVAWIYLTAWMARDQIVQFRNDVYDQDGQLVEATVEEKAFFEQAAEKSKTRTN